MPIHGEKVTTWDCHFHFLWLLCAVPTKVTTREQLQISRTLRNIAIPITKTRGLATTSTPHDSKELHSETVLGW